MVSGEVYPFILHTSNRIEFVEHILSRIEATKWPDFGDINPCRLTKLPSGTTKVYMAAANILASPQEEPIPIIEQDIYLSTGYAPVEDTCRHGWWKRCQQSYQNE